MRITPSCLRAADAGKHIIKEKPLTGYFGTAGDYFTEKLEAIRDGGEPRSGIDLAVECVNVTNAAYQSAETGYRVTLT